MRISPRVRVPVGSRVGAILSMSDDAVNLLGYGVYEGQHEPPFITKFKEKGELPRSENLTNSRIKLDDGRIVWGFQCTWGLEEAIREKIGERKIVPATIED